MRAGANADRVAGIAFTHGFARYFRRGHAAGCAGREGWRLLCSMRCRRRSAFSRARCCSACAELQHSHAKFASTDERAHHRAQSRYNSRAFSLQTPNVHIGSHHIEGNLVVAPMAGVTDRPFRQLCKRLGAGLAVSEMVASNPLLRGPRKSQRRADHARRGRADRRCRSPAPTRDRWLMPRATTSSAAPRSSTSTWAARRRRSATSRPARRLLQRRAAGRRNPRRRRRRGRRAGDAQDPHRLGPSRTATRCASRGSPRTRASRRCRCTAARASAASSGAVEYETIARSQAGGPDSGDRERRHRLAGKGARSARPHRRRRA